MDRIDFHFDTSSAVRFRFARTTRGEFDTAKAEFSEGVAVPQVRVTRLANEEIKRIMVARKEKK